MGEKKWMLLFFWWGVGEVSFRLGMDLIADFDSGLVCILYTSAWIWVYHDATLLSVLSECSGFQCTLDS